MEEDRAVRRTRLDRLLDQAARAGCDVPLAKMVLGMHHSPLSLSLSLSLPHNLCPASLRKIKINDESFVSALRDVKAEFLITSLHVVG